MGGVITSPRRTVKNDGPEPSATCPWEFRTSGRFVADIHFTPNAAMVAADYVKNVPINSGSYGDRKLFQINEYSDNEYNEDGRIKSAVGTATLLDDGIGDTV